ncbi:MAG TPA: DUF805 domain-containing protein [Allosphingosinicella sp.]|nr:DUF805 domain-containing protein [Allosphingosinicella sp.]
MDYMFLPLKRYAEFSGRSRRMEYWMFALFQILLWLVFAIVAGAIVGAALMSSDGLRALMAAGGSVMIVLLLACLIWLALLLPALAVGVRRLHDTDRSGWWLGGFLIVEFVSGFLRGSGSGLATVASIVAFVLAIVLLVFFCLDGTKGPNKYGPDPKGGVDAEVFA